MLAKRSLRGAIGRLFLGVALLALTLSAALIAMTTVLGRSSDDLASAVRSVQLARQAETQLLLHARAVDPLARADLAADLEHALREARTFVTTPSERQSLDAADAAVAAYLAASRPTDGPPKAEVGRLDAAFASLERLAAVNVAEAEAVRLRAHEVDRIANLVGLSFAAVLVFATAVLLWWLRARALRPVLRLSAAMTAFRDGVREARAPEDGAAEFALIARGFNEMAAELNRQRDAQFAFFAGVAHDLRNPLNVLKLSVARLVRTPALVADERAKSVLATMTPQLERLATMAADIMDASQIEAGRLKLTRAPGDLRTVVHQVTAGFADTSRAHRLDTKVPGEPVHVRFDVVRLEQVLTNLVSNAIKYSPRGGDVTVTLDVEDDAVLRVSDQGIGMEPRDVANLFEPFRRVGPNRDAIPGVGLGLFVVKHIVEAHGGRVFVQSVPGRGTTFEVRLPTHEGAGAGRSDSDEAATTH